MNLRILSVFAALGVLSLVAAPFATADDVAVKSDQVIVFGDGVARFTWVHDRDAGTVTFRSADPAVRISNPVVVVNTDAGPKEVALVAVDGQPGAWRLTHQTLRGAKFTRFDGTMKVVVAEKPYEAPLVVTDVAVPAPGEPREPAAKFVARHGGFVVAFPDCAAHIEAVLDRDTGTITIYALDENIKIVDAPTIVVTETQKPQTITLTKVTGETLTWRVVNSAFKTTTVSAKIRLMVDGKPCEAPLSFAPNGGRILTVQGGPRFEVVTDEKANTYTFYAIDETLNGKAVVIDTPPQVVWDTPEGPRTVTLVPVEREPRAWRLVWADASVSRPADARLRFTLFGKTLETNVGL